jgi:hypothetical protein
LEITERIAYALIEKTEEVHGLVPANIVPDYRILLKAFDEFGTGLLL